MKVSKYNRYSAKYSFLRKIRREHYRLFIYLFKEYFYGNMTYSDFIVILQQNDIQINESNLWNREGTLIFDYDTLEEVPDFIELHDNGGHIRDSNDRVEKYNPRSNSGVIKQGTVNAKVIVEVEE